MTNTVPNNIFLFPGTYSDLCKKVYQTKNLCVCFFFATWCSPCRKLAQQFPDLAKEYPDIYFIKVDIDANASLTDHYGVKSVPTIKFFKSSPNEELLEMSSINISSISAIKSKIEQYK